MRELKFKAWEKNLKEIIPVYNVSFVDNMINKDYAWRTFDEVILLQYTGLKDIQDKEIYEGDVVKFTKGSKKNRLLYVDFFQYEAYYALEDLEYFYRPCTGGRFKLTSPKKKK